MRDFNITITIRVKEWESQALPPVEVREFKVSADDPARALFFALHEAAERQKAQIEKFDSYMAKKNEGGQ